MLSSLDEARFVSVLFCLVGSSKTRRFTKNRYRWMALEINMGSSLHGIKDLWWLAMDSKQRPH